MLLSALKQALSSIEKIDSQTAYTAIVMTIEPVSLQPYLQLDDLPVYYMRDVEEELLGIGHAVDLDLSSTDDGSTQFQKLKDNLTLIDTSSTGTSPRLFGGFSFDNKPMSGIWSAFTSAMFVLPVIEIIQTSEATELIVTVSSEAQLSSIISNLEQRNLHYNPSNQRNKIQTIEYPITGKQWDKLISAAQEQMQQQQLEKVVLSRVCEIVTKEEIDPIRLMSNLHTNYPECYQFFFQPEQGSRFFGASPELLCQITGDMISTLALAGTRSRGGTEIEDEELATELFDNDKERREHQIVVDRISDDLQGFCTELSHHAEPSILKLSNVQHLSTPITAQLNPDHTIFDLIDTLHPTPALGGKPKQEAMQFIQEHEPHPRGMYASPIGWIDLELNGKVIVAIRSAVNQAKITWVYAGAGIMEESDAASEWEEIELKFKPILEALGVVL